MDIYGFEASEAFISDVEDKILPHPSLFSSYETSFVYCKSFDMT